MRERDVELHLRKEVAKRGGLCWKFTSPSIAGVPDRLVVLDNQTWFVELKAPGKKPTKMQAHRMDQLADNGANVTWLDSVNAVNEFLQETFNV